LVSNGKTKTGGSCSGTGEYAKDYPGRRDDMISGQQKVEETTIVLQKLKENQAVAVLLGAYNEALA